MSLTEKQKHDLKKFIKELEQYKGRHTELVSVYIPQGYDIVKIIQHIQQEQGTAMNIKSATTRKNVTGALERMVQHLRLYSRTPGHGLAVFSGNIAAEGQQDFRVWSIEPPIPVQTRIYRCDKDFELGILQGMLETKETYGLVVMDRRECVIAELRGKSITIISKHTSNVPGKFRAGGQSAQRFGRIRENAAKEFYVRVGEYIKEAFFNNQYLKGIIIGGPGPTKHELIEGSFITNELKKKIIAVKDITYTDEFGIHDLVDKSQDVLAAEELAGEKKLVNRFFGYLVTKPGMVTYGEQHVLQAIGNGSVDILLLSESLTDEKIESFEQEAKRMGTNVAIISTETREGAQLKDFGGIAAILRYEVNTET
ncbi:peptide chain release factor aRF-1 [Candidatus Woesearchaeota archaeon]|nr:peptide chain release factor aRF-1 [Candidatus Woesearchaeota archaeon]